MNKLPTLAEEKRAKARERIAETISRLAADPERERVMGMISTMSGKLQFEGDRGAMFTVNKLWHLMDAAGQTVEGRDSNG